MITISILETVQQEGSRMVKLNVDFYLDYAENQAARQIPMKMQDWVEKLDAFLQFNEYQILIKR